MDLHRQIRVYVKRQTLKNLKFDVPASIVVFLVALPLCLGIALASDAPLFSGIITGVIAGIIVGILSGSELSVSGPAAGLTVIVASGIKEAGSFEAFLCAVLLSGIIQIVAGLFRAGAVASLFPIGVIKGMLAAIGITIILKQIPYALGGFAAFESDMKFLEWVGQESTIAQLIKAFLSLNSSAVVISLASLALLITWESRRVKSLPILSKIPGPLVAVFLGAIVNQVFHLGFPSVALHATDGHLVQLPHIDSLSALWAQFRFPDFSTISNKSVWIIAVTLACVGSIETLLCIESTDKLDPQRRVSNPNRELVAQGVGNTLASLIGGIPMTSVIVRSSANIYAGARTRTSTILHGVILLVSALALAPILNLIPLASLAAVLLVVGFKLTHPSLWKKMYHSGLGQFLPFAITVAAIIMTDLLKGVLIGLCVGLVFVLKASYYSAFMVIKENEDVLIRFLKDVTFIHKIKLRTELSAIEPETRVLVDGTRALFIDHDIMEMLHEFKETAGMRQIRVELKDVEGKQQPPSPRKSAAKEKKDGVVQEADAREQGVGTRKAR